MIEKLFTSKNMAEEFVLKIRTFVPRIRTVK